MINGTALNNPSQTNPSYDDLSAIWDAYNGTLVGSYSGQGLNGSNRGSGNITSGAPAAWVNDSYVSATPWPSSTEYAALRVYDGLAFNHHIWPMSVALQALNPATFASAQYRRVGNTLQLTGSDFLSLGNAGVDIKGYINWEVFDYDTNGDSTVDVNFALADIASAKVISDSIFEVVLNAGSSDNAIGAYKLETASNFDDANATVGSADKLILGANAANDYSNAATMGVAQSPAGQSVIDLGGLGQLIAPVQVEGKWYYYWDRDKDGSALGNGASDSGDWTSHDALDGLFNQDIAGVTNTTVANADGQYGTTDTYRYGTLNGVRVALPTLNGEAGVSAQTAAGQGYTLPWSGTAYTDAGATSNGTTGPYGDFTAIWDAYNSTSTGNGFSGIPPQWPTGDGPWTATPGGKGHLVGALHSGGVWGGADDSFTNYYVALQVL